MLLDTSGLFAYIDSSERHHREAIHLLNSATGTVTHNYILAELVALCHARGIIRSKALEFVTDLVDNPDVAVVWVSEPEHRLAMDFLLARPDKSYSLCDAVSFVIMQRTGVTDALTTDHHFEQEGFIRLLKA